MRPSIAPRRRSLCVLSWSGACILLTAGCTSLLTSSTAESPAALALSETADKSPGETQLIQDVTVPWGTNSIKLEGVALVTGLAGTGSDPPPSPMRASLISEMQTHDVTNPNFILSSPDTSLVLVRMLLPPGVRKGDRLDVEVRVPSRSETASLRGGWLMQARLREVAMLDRSLRTGRVEALAEGPVVVDAVFQGAADQIREVRGRLLGGGMALSSRPLGLMVRSENHSVRTATLIAAAINARFHTFDRGVKTGVATPKRDNFIELEVHPRYRHNLIRYIRVVRNLPLRETPTEHLARLALLEAKLQDPATAATAAMQLEGIGKEAVPILAKALTAADPEIRFYAAEALAYMDEASAAETLGQTAREQPAFRWHAMAALAAMDQVTAHDALVNLLDVPSAETRYAAFLALRGRNSMDPLVRDQQLSKEFSYHAINTTAAPMIHFARSRRPEIVVFGNDLRLRPPAFLYAGKHILLKADGKQQITLQRFEPHKEDRQTGCSTRLEDVVRAIVQLGGGYSDVFQCLQEAKQKNYLDARVEVDALPRMGRTYDRDGAKSSEGDEPAPGQPEPTVDTPLAGLFGGGVTADEEAASPQDSPPPEESAWDEAGREDSPGFLRRVGGWLYGGN